MDQVSRIVFDLDRSTAPVAYYIMGTWPSLAERPVFDTRTSPMSISFALTSEVVVALQQCLAQAILLEPGMARSARALRMQLSKAIMGRVIPCAGTAQAAAG